MRRHASQNAGSCSLRRCFARFNSPAIRCQHDAGSARCAGGGSCAMQVTALDGRFGPLMTGTPKGDIRHLVPARDAIRAMAEPARPALLLFPSFGFDPVVREIGASEVFMRLTQASTNYVALGEVGFSTLTRFIKAVPARAIDYRDGIEAEGLVDRLWSELA